MNLADSRIVDIRVNNNLDVISDNAIMQCIHLGTKFRMFLANSR